MSWRLIFVVLLLAAGASAWGGLQLGDWLIAHGPAQIQMPKPHPELDQAVVLDANGKPYVASAPQVLPDGRQGVPELAPPVDWRIQQDSLLDAGRPIALATTTISMDEAIELASRNQLGDGLQGIAQFGSLGGSQVIQPIDVTTAPPPPPTAQTAEADGQWQAAFQAELKACESLGFFSRPSCAWAARNKYCEPHAAWGRVAGCPAKKSGF
ncbi:MAG: hypothetical protein RBR29_06725 [Castellaniella sp.]|uniref:hypothetical protein n=1 Tax=Castellaniella sp. TaxID=1955812 RepID=UPI002A363E99|nr:hypothetical protein [Castellaniella sp.]MDY0309470.1 hypothetical protein [Castellaniella sp.]